MVYQNNRIFTALTVTTATVDKLRVKVFATKFEIPTELNKLGKVSADIQTK